MMNSNQEYKTTGKVLSCNEADDSRVWVDFEHNFSWYEHFEPPIVLLHYPPRSGRWFWDRRLLPGNVRCPVGTIAIVPEILSKDETMEVFKWYEEISMGLCIEADLRYLNLHVGLVNEHGRLDCNQTFLVHTCNGEWETLNIWRADVDRLDPFINELLAQQNNM